MIWITNQVHMSQAMRIRSITSTFKKLTQMTCQSIMEVGLIWLKWWRRLKKNCSRKHSRKEVSDKWTCNRIRSNHKGTAKTKNSNRVLRRKKNSLKTKFLKVTWLHRQSTILTIIPLPTIVDKKNAQNLSAAKRLKSLKGKKLQQVQRLINKRALLIQMIKSKSSSSRLNNQKQKQSS